MQKSNKNNKDNISDANYLWDHFSIYSTRPEIKVTSRAYDTRKCQKASCSLENAVKFLYTDTSDDCTTDFIPRIKGAKDVKIGLNKIGKSSFLTDNGETFAKLKQQKQMKKSEFVKLIKNIDTDYDLSILNEELCVEIPDPSCLTDCYRNLVTVIMKVKCLAQYM